MSGVRTRVPPRLGALVLGLCACGAVWAGCLTDTAVDPDALRVAIPLDAGPLNPYSGSSSPLLGLVYDKLFEPSPYVPDPFPALATEALQLDSLEWRVRLRPGVTWHDGEPFTAEDVVFTYEYYRDGPPNRYTHHVSEVPQIDRIVEEDSLTVRFVCGYPCPTLARITLADLPIIAEHQWRGVDQPRSFVELPVGTGPYRLVDYRPDRSYRLEANAAYFLGTPAVRTLVLPVLPNASTALLALRTAEIDAAVHEVPPELQDQFARTAGIRLIPTSSLSIIELRPNYHASPLVDPSLRHALSLAVDRQSLVDRVFLGRGRPGLRGYPHPDSPWTDSTLRTPYDRDSAGVVLEASGYRDRDGDRVRESAAGTPLRLRLSFNGAEPGFLRLAEMLRAQLAEIGIAITLETLEAGALSDRVSARDYDLFLSEIGAHGVADPDQFIMSHRSGYLWRRDLPYPEWDALFEAWKAAQTVETRLEVSYRMQRLFNRQPTSIALVYPEHVWAVREDRYDGWRESLGYGIFQKWSFVEVSSAEPADAPGRTPRR